MSRLKAAFRSLMLVILLLGTASIAQEAEQSASDEEEGQIVEEIYVTGSRLAAGDPSARVQVITAEDIEARGFSTVEDIMRTIPHNFSSINNATNLSSWSSPLDAALGALSVGLSTANLRGLGSENTLVLKNGHRLAGHAGDSNHFVNLRDIPAASIERIEIYLDGASAVYGSDAVGGVINIITRKDYSGISVGAKQELSSTSADQTRYNAYLGRNWENGFISANISTTESDPYDSHEAGFTTYDNRPEYDGNPVADLNFSDFGARTYGSGVVSLSRWGSDNLTLPPGNDGRNASVDDFRRATNEDALLDAGIALDAGGATEDTGVTIEMEHMFFNRLRLFGEYSRTESETRARATTFGAGSWVVPASNAFNPFGRTVYVDYNTRTEEELGLIPFPTQTSDGESERMIAGFDFYYAEDSRVTLTYLNSTSDQSRTQWLFASRLDRNIDDPARTARINEILSSSDPNVAVNLFGDGTGQNPTIAELLIPLATSSRGTEITTINGHANGSLFELPAGKIGFVAGFEIEERVRGDEFGDFLQFDGVENPTRDLLAYFVEFSIPVLEDVTFTLQARRDEYETEGAVGETPIDPLNPFGPATPNLQKAEFGHTSPRIGISWLPIDGLKVRASWNESFKPPRFDDLFSTFDRTFTGFGAYDPLCACFISTASQESGPNPNLKPEISENLSFGLQWVPAFLPRLLIEVDYSEIEIVDRIASSFELGELLPVEIYGNLPEYFERDPSGTLIRSISRPANISLRGREELEINLRYQWETERFGTLFPSITYLRVLDQYDLPTDDAPKVHLIGETRGVDEYSLIAQLDWLVNDKITVTMYVDHTPSYLNTSFEGVFGRALPPVKIDSRTTVDLSARYVFDMGLSVRVGGRNIFDADFPYALGTDGSPYDSTRVDLRGQVWFAEVKYDLDF